MQLVELNSNGSSKSLASPSLLKSRKPPLKVKRSFLPKARQSFEG